MMLRDIFGHPVYRKGTTDWQTIWNFCSVNQQTPFPQNRMLCLWCQIKRDRDKTACNRCKLFIIRLLSTVSAYPAQRWRKLGYV